MTPGRKFSTTTSAYAASARSRSRSASAGRSTTKLPLLRLAAWKYVAGPRWSYGGPHARVSSPVPGRSTLITVAPRSASIMVANGPASTREKSRMVSSPRGGGPAVRSAFTGAILSDIALAVPGPPGLAKFVTPRMAKPPRPPYARGHERHIRPYLHPRPRHRPRHRVLPAARLRAPRAAELRVGLQRLHGPARRRRRAGADRQRRPRRAVRPRRGLQPHGARR